MAKVDKKIATQLQGVSKELLSDESKEVISDPKAIPEKLKVGFFAALRRKWSDPSTTRTQKVAIITGLSALTITGIGLLIATPPVGLAYFGALSTTLSVGDLIISGVKKVKDWIVNDHNPDNWRISSSDHSADSQLFENAKQSTLNLITQNPEHQEILKKKSVSDVKRSVKRGLFADARNAWDKASTTQKVLGAITLGTLTGVGVALLIVAPPVGITYFGALSSALTWGGRAISLLIAFPKMLKANQAYPHASNHS